MWPMKDAPVPKPSYPQAAVTKDKIKNAGQSREISVEVPKKDQPKGNKMSRVTEGFILPPKKKTRDKIPQISPFDGSERKLKGEI